MSNTPPWIKKTVSLFKPEQKTTGNKSENHAKVYNTDKWRKLSTQFRQDPPMTCSHPHCNSLAEMVDHIIPINKGGSIWDRRNWEKLCNRHHNIKRGKEAHGHIEPFKGTKTGNIPLRRIHLPQDIAGESYLTK